MTDYKPNYESREAHYAAKDAAMASRDRENVEGGPQPRDEPKVHDYRQQVWGWSLTFRTELNEEGTRWAGNGYGSGVRPGDYVFFTGKGGGYGCWRIAELKYLRDPPDWYDAIFESAQDAFYVDDDGKIVKSVKEKESCND